MTRFRCFSCSRCFYLALFVACVLAWGGCDNNEAPTGKLLGAVSSSGEAVGDCIVSLYNPTSKRAIGGKVDDDGNFLIKKMPLGTYNIAVLQRTTNEATNEPFDKRIPAKYRDRKTSGFQVTISEGDNSVTLEMER